MTRSMIFACVVFLCASASAFCQTVDPPLWTVVSNGSGGFIGQNFLYNNEVNQLGTTNELGLYVQGGSPNTTNFNPFYLILAFVNQGTPFTAPTITTVNVYDNAGTPNAAGNLTSPGAHTTFSSLTINPFNTLSWTGNPQNDAYSALGFTAAGGNSQNFSNWTTAESKLPTPITATSFLLEVYDLSSYSNNSAFTGNGLIDMNFNSTLPAGTIAIGYACGPTNCTSNPNPFANPFTQGGITTGGGGGQTPEPFSLGLLVTACVFLGNSYRKRVRSV